MLVRKTLCLLFAVVIIGLSSCKKERTKEEVLTGIPIVTGTAVACGTAELSIMIKREDGKYVLP